MPRKMKVFRTAIGFHDAYVAAPSQKAALEYWGSDADLFARGMAELVTDEALAKEPLEHPGKVIRRLRGSTDEHMAELAKQEPLQADAGAPGQRKRSKPRAAPSRDALNHAEAAIEDARARHDEALEELRARERQLQAERRALEATHEREITKLDAAAEKARLSYQAALDKWRA